MVEALAPPREPPPDWAPPLSMVEALPPPRLCVPRLHRARVTAAPAAAEGIALGRAATPATPGPRLGRLAR